MGPPHRRSLLLCVLALQGVLWQLSTAASLCGDVCATDVRPVCGSDGRSYSNACVASCAGVAVSTKGYCPGDKIRFQQDPSSSSSSSSDPHAHERMLQEATSTIIPASVLNKFAGDGYVYRGKVNLALLNQRTGYKPRPASKGPPKEHSAMFQELASGQGSTVDSSSSSTAAAPKPTEQSRAAAKTPAPAPAAAAAPVRAADQDVALVRVDNAGNMYTKTYTYNPSRYKQLAYPPFNPAGTTLVETKLTPAPTAAASGQQAAAAAAPAANTAAKTGASVGAVPTPKPAVPTPTPVPANSIRPTIPPAAGAAAGRNAAGAVQAPSTAAVKAPAKAERKPTGGVGAPLEQTPVGGQGAARQIGQQGQGDADLRVKQGGRTEEQQSQAQGAPVRDSSSSDGEADTSSSSAVADSTQSAGAVEQKPAEKPATAAAAAAEVADPQFVKQELTGVPAGELKPLKPDAKQQLSSGTQLRRNPDYLTLNQQATSELAKDAVKTVGSSGAGSSSSSSLFSDAVQGDVTPESAAVDSKGTLGKQVPGSSSSSSSSSKDTGVKNAVGKDTPSKPPGPAAVFKPVDTPAKTDSNKQQQQVGSDAAKAPAAAPGTPAAAKQETAPAGGGTKELQAADAAKTGAPAAGEKPLADNLKQPTAAAAAKPATGDASASQQLETKPPTAAAPPKAAGSSTESIGKPSGSSPSTSAPSSSSSSSSSTAGDLKDTVPASGPAAKPGTPSSSSSSSPAKAPKALAPCNSDGLYCRDKISATSPVFGVQPKGGRYVDQAWLVGKARISSVRMYYNTSSGCLRGLQLTYTHSAAAGSSGGSSGGSGSSSSSSGSSSSGLVQQVQLLGSDYMHKNITVKELKLREDEVIGKAEIWDPKCIKYLRLFTSKGQKVSVGHLNRGFESQARNVTKNRDNGRLAAVKGWQDAPVKHAATAKKPASSSSGVLKQLQFVWSIPFCDHKCTQQPAAAAATAATAAVSGSAVDVDETPGSIITEAGSMPSTGHHHRLLLQQQQQQRRQHQEQQQQWIGEDDGLDALLQAQEHLFAKQHQERLAAAAAAAESQEPALELSQDDDWATAELESLATMQQTAAVAAAAAAAAAAAGSSGSNGSSVAVPASIHRMLSVIKPDNRLACPAKTYPYYAMGQIKAKASDGGFVCSGGLIGSNRVLTAGHCVWDDRNAQGPFKDLRFAPGQWKVGGKTESPFGSVDWDYVTLFDNYINDPDGEGLPFDVAVITLTKPVGTELGWLGIRAAAPPCKSTPLTLTLAGYPGEDPENPIAGGWAGGCWYDKCDVAYSCSVSITNHTCDSYVGQSGAPMFDNENYVRAVHTLGVLPGFSTTNGAITIQKFLLDNVMGYWRDTDGYTQTKSPAQAKRGKKLFQR